MSYEYAIEQEQIDIKFTEIILHGYLEWKNKDDL